MNNCNLVVTEFTFFNVKPSLSAFESTQMGKDQIMKNTIYFIAWVLKESSSTLRIHSLRTITVMTTPTLTASSCFWHVWIPTRYNSRGSGSCFNYWLRCDLVLIILQSQYPFLLTQVETMTQQTETCMSRAIRITTKCYSAPIGLINRLISFTFRIHWTTWLWIFSTPHHQVMSSIECSLANCQR